MKNFYNKIHFIIYSFQYLILNIRTAELELSSSSKTTRKACLKWGISYVPQLLRVWLKIHLMSIPYLIVSELTQFTPPFSIEPPSLLLKVAPSHGETGPTTCTCCTLWPLMSVYQVQGGRKSAFYSLPPTSVCLLSAAPSPLTAF